MCKISSGSGSVLFLSAGSGSIKERPGSETFLLALKSRNQSNYKRNEVCKKMPLVVTSWQLNKLKGNNFLYTVSMFSFLSYLD